jgi:hypothetical protein
MPAELYWIQLTPVKEMSDFIPDSPLTTDELRALMAAEWLR